MNFQILTSFCSVYYLITQYGVLGEHYEKALEEVRNNIKIKYTNTPKFPRDDPVHKELYAIGDHMDRCLKTLRKIRIQRKKKNILFYKVRIDSNRVGEMERIVLNIISNYMGVTVNPSEVDFIRLITRDSENNSIILLGLTTFKRKAEILRKSKRLKQWGIGVSDDFTSDVLARRRALYPAMIAARNEGLHATLIYDKLYINYTLITFKPRRKNNTEYVYNQTKRI